MLIWIEPDLGLYISLVASSNINHRNSSFAFWLLQSSFQTILQSINLHLYHPALTKLMSIASQCHPNPTHARARQVKMQTATNPNPAVCHPSHHQIPRSHVVGDRATYRRVQQTSHHRHQLMLGQGTRELYLLRHRRLLLQFLRPKRSRVELASESNSFKR